MDPPHQLVRVMHERRDPAAPHAVGCGWTNDGIKIDVVQISLDSGDIGDSSFSRSGIEHVEKPARALDGDHASARPHDLREIERRVAGSASEVENPLALNEAGALPRVEYACSPDRVLHAESPHFLVVRAEQVIAITAQR